MPFTTTAKYALRRLTGSSLVSDVDAGFSALADDIDSKMVGYGQGTLAARPVSTASTPGATGRRYYATDLSLEFVDLGTSWAPSGLPIGGGIDWYGTGDPCAELMICDGRAISRATYAALFAKLSTAFGVGNGSTTFNLPNAADRALVGVSGTVPRGATGGAKTHTLTTAEMPSHQHQDNAWNAVGGGLLGYVYTNIPDRAAIADVPVGGGQSHNNMQPYLGAYKAIRVL